MSFVMLPFSGLFFLGGLIPTAFGLGAGRGFGLAPITVKSVIVYGAAAIDGALIGAIVGFVAARIGRKRARTETSTWWARARRPIRLFRDRPARPGRRRWPWLVGVPVALILATAFGLGVYAGRFVDRRLAAAIAATARDDPNWQLDRLMAARQPVPDDENSALIVAEVVARVPQNWPGQPQPAPGMPLERPSAVPLAIDRIGEMPDNVMLDAETADTVRQELQRLGEAVALARTLAEYRRGRHELDLTPILINTSLQESQNARTVARLLRADAIVRAQQGDMDGAIDSCRGILGVARSIGDNPFLIAGLVRIAMTTLMVNTLQRVLAQGEASDGALARLQAELLEEHNLVDAQLLGRIRGERAIQDEILRRLREAEIPIAALSEEGWKGGPVPGVGPWAKVWFDNQRAISLEWMNEFLAIAQQPPQKRLALWRARDVRIEHVVHSRFGKFIATLPALLSPGLSSAGQASLRSRAELATLAILVAAERHRRKTGQWPRAVAGIDPAILPTAPADPFSGAAFLIDQRDGLLIVHSVGPNARDEHGTYDVKRWEAGVSDDVGASACDVALRRQPADPE